MKLLLIGFDGLDYDMLKPWLEKHPNAFINSLDGTLCTMKPSHPITSVGWPEIYTGKTGEKSEDSKSMWELFGEEYTVGMLGLPLTHPAKSINGWWVSGYPAKLGKSICFPKSIWDKYLVNHIVDLMDIRPKPKGLEQWKQENENLTFNHMFLITMLEYQSQSDILLCQFSFVDHLAHLVGWQEDHPDRWKLVEYVHGRVDQITRTLYTIFEPENLVLCSDHGWPSSSNHTFTGTMFIQGDDVRQVEGVEMRNIDLLPTLLYLLDLPPTKCDGECRYDLFKSQVISEEDEQVIMDKMRRLGYIE